MCGIAGMFMFDGSAAQARNLGVLAQMSSGMRRRGPDDEGSWHDTHCALAFRRLAILDLSPAGHQPMLTPDGRHVLVFNGEVYNFRDLRHELEHSGVRFRSSGDAEVVLKALAVWGVEALSRFNGMFALAWYDVQSRRLRLARDPMGIKPLYVLRTTRSVVFASQYDQLLDHPEGRDGRLSADGLALYLRFGHIPAPWGILEDTGMLEPGSWLTVDSDGAITSKKYFEFPRNQDPDLSGSVAMEAVDAAVTRAVKRQMVSDVPLGCFLSGGIDSPLVAAKMTAASPNPVQAFTMELPGHESDESADAGRYARELGVAQVSQPFNSAEAAAMLDEVVDACGEPFADDSIFPTMFVAKLARERVTVMLSGDGGDELFWGYAGRFASVLALARRFSTPFAARQVQRLGRRLAGRRNPDQHLLQRTIGDWYRVKHSHRLPEHRLAALWQDVPPLPQDFGVFDYKGHAADETARWLRWNEVVGHLPMVLLKVDRASMHHSLEVRVPLLDQEVVELATRIDWRSCLDLETGLGKLPLRTALSRHVSHQSREKRGFGAPMAQWLRGPFLERLQDTLMSRRELLGYPLKSGALDRLVLEHLTGQEDQSASLWLLLSLALWEERHLRRAARSAVTH